MNNIVHVAVGVVVDVNGKILIARRAKDVHQGGLWEFPGGKVDPGELVSAALARELREELAIDVKKTEPLIQIRHNYADKSVLLDVHKVTAFTGIARGNEGQPVRWVLPVELVDYSFPAANKAIISALTLPDKMLVTGAFSSTFDFLSRVESALTSGIKLVQFRCSDLSTIDYQILAESLADLCGRYQARLTSNTNTEIFSSIEEISGLHLNRHELMRSQARPVKESVLLGASCHDSDEIAQARKIGVDYICLSPVAATSSHADAIAMGWENFSELAKLASVPVYALGGMNVSDVEVARGYGGQGIAAISSLWGI